MVRLVNLDDEGCEEVGGGERFDRDIVVEEVGENLNYETAFSRALGCYP